MHARAGREGRKLAWSQTLGALRIRVGHGYDPRARVDASRHLLNRSEQGKGVFGTSEAAQPQLERWYS